MKKKITSLASTFGVLTATIISGFALSAVAQTYTGPASAPPNGNVAMPLNVGNSVQTKAGGSIQINGGFGIAGGPFVYLPSGLISTAGMVLGSDPTTPGKVIWTTGGGSGGGGSGDSFVYINPVTLFNRVQLPTATSSVMLPASVPSNAKALILYVENDVDGGRGDVFHVFYDWTSPSGTHTAFPLTYNGSVDYAGSASYVILPRSADGAVSINADGSQSNRHIVITLVGYTNGPSATGSTPAPTGSVGGGCYESASGMYAGGGVIFTDWGNSTSCTCPGGYRKQLISTGVAEANGKVYPTGYMCFAN